MNAWIIGAEMSENQRHDGVEPLDPLSGSA